VRFFDRPSPPGDVPDRQVCERAGIDPDSLVVLPFLE